MSATDVDLMYPRATWDAAIATREGVLVDLDAARRARRVGSFAYMHIVKPAIDSIGGAIAVIVTLPIVALIAVAIRIQLGPGVMFRQQRVGLNGRRFTIYKFRTMRPPKPGEEAEAQHGNHKRDDDPRHTPLGRLLRKTSLDELPQLWNVVLGDMSLVGPRPELVNVVDNYEPWQHRRHAVKPGLTGLWQISERGAGPMHEHVDVDLDYVRSVSFATDASIMLKTVPALLLRRGGH